MKTPPAALQKHLYSWMVNDCEREILDGFPTLRKIAGSRLARFFEIMDARSKDEQRQYCLAHLKVIFYEASMLPSKDEILCAPKREERMILRRLQSEFLTPSKGEQEQAVLSLKGKPRKFIPKRLLQSRLRQELPNVLGPIDWKDGAEWGHLSEIRDVAINTNVDTGGYYQVRLEHDIGHRALEIMELSFAGCNCLFWLGTNLAYWDQITEGNFDESMQSILAAARRFLIAVRMSQELCLSR